MRSTSDNRRSPCRVEHLRERFLEGDNVAFEELLALYMPLLKFIARRYCRTQGERDDFLAEAVFSFLHAVRTYEMRKGTFDSYVAVVASHRLIDLKRRSAGARVELTDALDNQGNAQDDRGEGVPFDLVALCQTLSPLEKACFERRLRGETINMIAGSVNVSKASVSNAIARAKRKLERALS